MAGRERMGATKVKLGAGRSSTFSQSATLALNW